MRYKLVNIEHPYKPGFCPGCCFWANCEVGCKKPCHLISCIRPNEASDHLRYKHYKMYIDTININIKVL